MGVLEVMFVVVVGGDHEDAGKLTRRNWRARFGHVIVKYCNYQ